MLTPASLIGAADARKGSPAGVDAQDELACSVSRLVVLRSDSVTIAVFAPRYHPTEQTQAKHTWRVTGGTIDSGYPTAVWRFTGEEPGERVATIHLPDALPEGGDCSVRVFIEGTPQDSQPIRGLPRETGAAFLLPDKVESAHYGLYTYLLLAARPTPATQQKYEEFIVAFLAMVPQLARLEHHVRPSELNAAYLPVTRPPPETLSVEDLRSFLLVHYDYARARVILRAVRGVHRDGPYIVSTLSPVTGDVEIGDPCIQQDLTLFPVPVIQRVVREFLIQAAQDRPHDTRLLPQLVLGMQATVHVLAQARPDLQRALRDWIR